MGQTGQQSSSGEQKSGKGEKNGEGKQKSGENGKEGKGEEGNKGENSMGKDGKNGEGDEGGQQGGQRLDGPSEEELKEIYEIYKEQQLLRQQLEEQLQDMINARDKQLAQKLIRQMEDFENDLLENGVTQRTLNKINTIQHQLLKLENATLKQGREQERESNINKDQFQNPITTKPSILENYRDEIEILNRQALPLRQIFQDKVRNYFKRDD